MPRAVTALPFQQRAGETLEYFLVHVAHTSRCVSSVRFVTQSIAQGRHSVLYRLRQALVPFHTELPQRRAVQLFNPPELAV